MFATVSGDIRTSAAGSGLVPQARPAERSEAAKAAQRAFFQAALNGAAPVAATSPRTAQPTVSPAVAVQARSDGNPPSRMLRPGSLLDIKV